LNVGFLFAMFEMGFALTLSHLPRGRVETAIVTLGRGGTPRFFTAPPSPGAIL
jgi:hypothetical protein